MEEKKARLDQEKARVAFEEKKIEDRINAEREEEQRHATSS